MSGKNAQSWRVVDVQNLYDVFVKYVDPLDPSLRQCIVCLCVANPYERLLRMECCRATSFHFSCWFDAPHGRNRTIFDVNRDIQSAGTIPLGRRCPTCQRENACAIEIEDHVDKASKKEVVCKLCEERYTAFEWFQHWPKCGGALVRLDLGDEVTACVDERTSPSPLCDSRFWDFGIKAKQTLMIILSFLVCLALVSLIMNG